MEEEIKAVNFKIEEGFFILSVDPNKNGTPVLQLKLDLAEIPKEVIDVIKK